MRRPKATELSAPQRRAWVWGAYRDHYTKLIPAWADRTPRWLGEAPAVISFSELASVSDKARLLARPDAPLLAYKTGGGSYPVKRFRSRENLEEFVRKNEAWQALIKTPVAQVLYPKLQEFWADAPKVESQLQREQREYVEQRATAQARLAEAGMRWWGSTKDGWHLDDASGVTIAEVKHAKPGEVEGGLGAMARMMIGAQGAKAPPLSPAGWYWMGTVEARGVWSRPEGPFFSVDEAKYEVAKAEPWTWRRG
jgi:hypothetical protein